MSKIVNGVEYLTYAEAASEYGYSRSSIQSMVSRDIFKNAKFPHDSKAYVSRNEVEAYKNRKNKTTDEVSPSVDEREVPQGIPFSIQTQNMLLMEAIRLCQQIENNRQQVENSRQQDLTVIRELMKACSQPA